MVGARTSIAVALVAVGIGIGIGVPLGLAAAATRGSLLDELIMRANDLVFAFPSLVIAILITAVFGPSAFNAILAIGIFNIPVFARVARGGALSLWTLDYVLAARTAGKAKARISVEHILPNIANLLVVQATIQFSLGILAEAALSYVGLGAQPPTPSWGRMLAEAQTMIYTHPALAILPGLSIVFMVLGLNLLGDGLRDLLDPRIAAGARMISIENLCVAVDDTPILNAVDLEITPGRILGLVGESGSGKSMTSLALMGLLPENFSATGAILLNGKNLLEASEAEMCGLRGNAMGMIFQEPMTALNPVQTIGDQVAETLTIHGAASRAEARVIAREKLDRVGLSHIGLGAFPHELSGGQRQRVSIAAAIALRPELLIADEPTTALDVTTQAQILDLLRDLAAEENMALLLITHDLAVVSGMADEIAVMRKGEIVEKGPTATVLRDRKHPYTQALFEASSHQPEVGDTAPDGAILELKSVRRTYPGRRQGLSRGAPVVAVNDVSFSLKRGESLGLVGESGCGKSTLSRAILGLEAVQGGSITLNGGAVSPQMPREARASIQVVFQDPYGSFNPRWRVDRIVSEPFHLYPSLPADWRDRVARRALKAVELSADDMRKYPHEFSGGQRQRIAIARALITQPDVVVLDEAVSALDVRIRAQVLDLLADLRARFGLSYLFISHDLTVVRAITDRVMVMQAGNIVEEGPTGQVFDTPQHDYTKALLAAAPTLEIAQ